MNLQDVRGRAVITPAEFSELFGQGIRQVYQAIHAGRIPSIRIGERKLVIPVPALLRLLGADGEER